MRSRWKRTGPGLLWLTALALCPGAALAACAGRSAGAGASSRAGSAAPQSRGEAETPAEAQRERRRVQRAVRDFADALEGRSLRAVIEMLDEDSFDDRARFEDQVNALLRQSREMRVLFRESSLEVKGGRASMTVDAEMIFALRGRTRQDVRRKERLQFDFVRTARGWKVSALTPRQFFMP